MLHIQGILYLALEAVAVGIRVLGIDSAVTSLAKGGISAVGAINSVKEGVKKALAELLAGGIIDIVCLEEDAVLWIDDWVGNLEVKIGLAAGSCHRGCTAIDALEDGFSACGNVPVGCLSEYEYMKAFV